MCIQRNQKKRLVLGPSEIPGAGWGAFLLEGARKGDFVSEYLGDLISQEEAERRGRVDDKRKSSYLFDLNEGFVVDAARKGNKSRFINHSDCPNVQATVINHR